MLFNSYIFIFGFLPVSLLIYVAVDRQWGRDGALLWLAIASVVFYGQWSPAHAALLTGSILVNYAFGRAMIANRDKRTINRLTFLVAISTNILLLAYFKYANFIIDNVNDVMGSSFSHLDVFLAVGISYFTFIQIGYLVEVYNRQVTEIKFSHYFLFGSFFPCVTAGPIILQKEMMAQFSDRKRPAFDPSRFAVGLSFFGFGLFKKLILADGIAPFADVVFDGVAGGAVPAAGTAWIGALAYTFQLYFDFSGYSDMALGAAYLFGFKLPINFNSPLKAGSITDFWRRWHMTMTRFFTNYLYSPIGVSLMRWSIRNAHGRQLRFLAGVAFPVIVTFVLAGLWHGAGWTFIVFGLIHGVALAANHAWREARIPPLPYPAGWALTMAVVVTGLVFFRAENVPIALTLLGAMVGIDPVGAADAAVSSGVLTIAVDLETAVAWIAALAGIALLFPNTQEVMRKYWVTPGPAQHEKLRWSRWCAWRPSFAWAAVTALVLVLSLGSITGESQFIYYDF